MEIREIESAIEGILFAAGESVPIARIASVLELDYDTVLDIANLLSDYYTVERRGIRLIRLEDSLQLCSSPEWADTIRTVLETRKPPSLSAAAMEVLSIIAYYQPTTKTYIEKIRGVDSSYTVGLLQSRGLIEECGRLNVPGRPILYKTTDVFLRTFGLSSLNELPEIPELTNTGEDQLKIKEQIDRLGAENSASVIANEADVLQEEVF